MSHADDFIKSKARFVVDSVADAVDTVWAQMKRIPENELREIF